MAVYAVQWNPFHPGVFLSCSADWTVKLWSHKNALPIMTFDLNTAVGDVAWAPFSSTVFACITTDGKLRVYDLDVNKHEPIGETRVNKKAKLTHIAFNPKEPIICVGDDRGVVNILKLSGNLRRMTAPSIDELDPAVEEAKLDRLLVVPEPTPADLAEVARIANQQ
jgi:dynein intermediate chain 1